MLHDSGQRVLKLPTYVFLFVFISEQVKAAPVCQQALWGFGLIVSQWFIR